MFEVVSSAANTQWHTFPNLHTRCTYSHVGNEQVDFQLIGKRNCILEVNKKAGFELLRTYTKNNVDMIQRLKKRQMDDLQCGAASKVYGSEIALGLSTGFVRLFNIQSGEFLPIKLKPNEIGNSVTALSYSSCDEYLAALYENGETSIFGLKTNVKMDTVRFDGITSIIEFHPTKRFALAAGSDDGAVTMHDIQAKRKLFFDRHAHAGPVRGIAMCDATPEVFMTCSYDCNLNVYDLRKRNIVKQAKQAKPLSTVALSPCGTFCIAGNLKGDLITYDFRNLKEELGIKRAHNSAVVRAAFVPSVSDSNTTMDRLGDSLQSIATHMATPLVTPHQANANDSFHQFIDLCMNRDSRDASSPLRNRDSLLELVPSHDFSMDSVISPSRMSVGALDFSELRLKRLPRISLNNSTANETTSGAKRETLVPTIVEEPKLVAPHPAVAKRTRLTESAGGGLSEIEEEDVKPAGSSTALGNELHPNKENQQNNQQDIESFNQFIKNTHVSTPNTMRATARSAERKHFDLDVISQVVNETVDRMRQSVSAELNDVKAALMARVNETENQIKFLQDEYYHKSFLGNFNIFRSTQREIDDIKEALAILLRSDPFAEEFFRLKEENEQLKLKLSNSS